MPLAPAKRRSQDDATETTQDPMPFTIAIIGRPNVGKSTLFNRLAGKRLALVNDLPGLTRDRRDVEISLGRKPVRLIDTAGLEEARDDSLTARMRAQSEAAMAEAHLLLFLIDARTGLTPLDETFAEQIRTSGKPVIVVANKCEGKAGEAGYLEAFSLGLGDPVPLSAEHGEGMGDLLARIEAVMADQTDAIGEKEERQIEKPLRIAIVGRPNAGKSTLINALLGEERLITGPEAGITRDAIAVDMTWEDRPVRLFDTAGLRRRAKVQETAEKLSVGDALRAIRFAEVVVLLMDATHPLEKQDLAIADLVEKEGRALVLAFSKWDLVRGGRQRLSELREAVERLLPQVKGVPLVTLSAPQGKGLDALRQAVFRIWEIWNRRLPTAQLNRFLAEAVARHPPPAPGGRRLRLRYMTQPNARPPTFVVFCSRPSELPQAYVRYLINGLRETFDLPGVPIRLHMRKGKNPYVKDTEREKQRGKR